MEFWDNKLNMSEELNFTPYLSNIRSTPTSHEAQVGFCNLFYIKRIGPSHRERGRLFKTYLVFLRIHKICYNFSSKAGSLVTFFVTTAWFLQ